MESFTELYMQHGAFVHQVLCRFTRDADRRDDWAQAVWIQVWRKSASHASRASFRSWLYRITVNTALYALRAEKRRREFLDRVNVPERASTGSPLDKIYLAETLRALPRAQRRVVLRWLQGYAHAEIAELLAIGTGTSKSHLSRARAHLRRAEAE